MRFLSLFSGIEAATCAWNPLGWECAAVAEVEPFPCALLKHHYPEVPNMGDVTKITADQIKALGHIDLVCGGFPCQDLSVAGKRKGLNNADGTSTRSGLFFDAMRIADWANPRWLFIENVPGMFSSNAGRDFAAVVGEMAGCEFDVPRDGWRNAGVVVGPRGLVEWSVMDAQYHGLAQRRKRVFIVRDSGDWANRPPIFLEPYRLQGHPAPRRKAGEVVTGTISARTEGGGGLGTDFECSGGVIAQGVTIHGTDKTARVASFTDVAGCLRARMPGSQENSSTTVVAQTVRTLCVATGQAGAEIGAGIAPTLNCNHEAPYVCGTLDQSIRKHSGQNLAPSIGAANPTAVAFNMHKSGNAASSLGISQDRTDCLRAFEKSPFAVQPSAGMRVRRLTPGECEKLQGFPVGYTAVPHRGKPAADGPRYKSLGNSWAVPNVRWIGERINAVNTINALRQAA